MAQVQNQTKLPRFAGPSLIHDVDHMSGIPQVQDEKNGQVQQGQSDRLTKNSKDGRAFEYHNPRQYS